MRPLRITVPFTPIIVAIGLLSSMSAVAADNRWNLAGPQHPGEPDRPVWSIAVSPWHPNVLFEATQGLGILRSNDGGSTWTPVVGGNPAAWVVRVDPQRPGVVYGGTQAGGIFKSLDEGRTWTPQNQGLTTLDVRSIDASADLVLIGTSAGLFYSNDGAATWQAMGLSDLSIAAVTLLPKAGGVTMFAGADNGSASGYLFRSEDLTARWTSVIGGFPGDATIASLASGSAPSTGGEPPILAGTAQGLYRSDDRGKTWTQVSGLPATDFNALEFNPANSDQIYAGSDGDAGSGGVFRSLDRGATWSPLGSGLPSRPRVTALAVEAASVIQVFAATWNPTSGAVGVYRIADPGAAPTGATAAPGVSPTPQTRPSQGSTNSVPISQPVASSLEWQKVGIAALALLLLGAIVLIRRWRFRREDQRTFLP